MAAVKECLATVEPLHYSWSFPGSPIRVHLDLQVVIGIQERLRKTEATATESGLLLGEADTQITRIRDSRVLSKIDAAEVKRAIANAKPGSVVGYYRIQRGDALRLDENDLALAEACFLEPHQVFLVVQHSENGPGTASFFFREGGRMNGDFPFLEFPFDAALLAAAERHKTEAVQRRMLEMPLPVEPAAVPPVRPRKPRVFWRVVAWMFIAAAFIAGSITYVRLYPEQLSRLLALVPRSGTASAPIAPSMGLQAERNNGDLKLSWNRNSAAIAGAASGKLSIQDGSATLEFPLEGSQVRSGSILYSPLSDRVQFQLTVSGASGSNTESVIVIVPRTGPPQVQAVAPRPAAAHRYEPEPEPETEAARSQPLRPFTPPAPAQRRDAPQLVEEAPALAASAPSSTLTPALILNRQIPQPLRAPPPSPAPSSTVPLQPRSQPHIQLGGQVYHPPQAIRQVTPSFPQALRSVVLKPKVVEVLVSIDEAGKVLRVEPTVQRDVHQMMVSAALSAAQQWKFRPARRGDRPIASQMVLKFNFEPAR